jgi:hypothetical protein
MALAHIVGPEAQRAQNSQIISGARSRDQAALVYKLAEKMVRFNPEVRKIIKPIPSQKLLIGGAAARVLHVLCLSGWMAANVAGAQDPAGNLTPAKDRSASTASSPSSWPSAAPSSPRKSPSPSTSCTLFE